ncbi:MAG: sulfite exporter TauE/SafE family protein [Alphaproteobacteria bacterium]
MEIGAALGGSGEGIAGLPTELLLGLSVMLGGFLAGVLGGFFGVGGGIVIVPMLFHVFGFFDVDDAVRMHQAVATSLATIIVTSIRSVDRHARHGAVDGSILRAWGLPIVAGVAAGSLAAGALAGPVLSAVFVVLALLMAAHLAFGREAWRLGDGLPANPWRSLQGAGIGFFSTLVGVGGGTFGISLMTLYGVAIHRAVGTASGLGLIIGIPATLGLIAVGWGEPGRAPFSVGFVNLLAFALIVPMTMLSVPIGVRLAHARSRAVLRRAFAVFLTLTALSMAADLLTGR